MNSKTGWTIRYSLLNIAYFAAFCTIHACAAVYLLAHGFTNTQIGILLALANVVSAIAQPAIAGIIDKPGPLTNRRFIMISVTVILAGSVILLFVHNNMAVIFTVYAVIYMIQFVYQPVMTALCFEYQKAGCDIFYGLARGLGSAGFAVTSAFIGSAVERSGVKILPVVSIITMVISLILIATFVKPKKNNTDLSEKDDPDDEEFDGGSDNTDDSYAAGSKPSAHNNIIDFARMYPAFMLFMAGVICFFFAHNMINDFMIQIIRSLGGAETELGYANFLQAILELPVMALIGVILKKISDKRLLVISGIAFFIKILILVFARGMAMFYISQCFQLFAYAVFIPAGAYYVSRTMDELDQVKGQAFITSAITLGGVFSNLISGVILDHLGITFMLITGSVVCFIGVVIGYIAMSRLPHRCDAAADTQIS